MEKTIEIKIDNERLDEAVEKANRLVELLKEAQQIAGSLLGLKNVSSQVAMKSNTENALQGSGSSSSTQIGENFYGKHGINQTIG